MPRTNGFLGPAHTSYYRPTVHSWSWNLWQSGQRGFVLQDVELMRRDPKIQLGLRILATPLFQQKWAVESKNPKVSEFVDSQFRRFWRHDLITVLRLLAWGYCPAEPLYRVRNQRVEFDRLKDLHPLDCVPLDTGGLLTGIKVNSYFTGGGGEPVKLRYPRKFWVTLEPEYGSYFGRSRLAGAWDPWMEKTGRHGARESRRLWYIKNAFRGGTIRHPPGMIELDGGQAISCQDYARELLEKFENGGILVLPNAKDPDSGEYLWVYEPPAGNGEMRDIREYPKDLDREELEGMGILPEVAQASETGSGWSGRSVPFLVFLTGEDLIAQAVAEAFDEFCCRGLVLQNFGGAVDYEIKLQSLTTLAGSDQQPGEPNPAAGQAPRTPAPPGPGQRPAPPPPSAGAPRPARPIQLSIREEIRQRVEDLLHRPPIALAHAPVGGVTIAGQRFKGGQFIPAEVLAHATPAEKAQLESTWKPAADVAAAEAQIREFGVREVDLQKASVFAANLVGRFVGDPYGSLLPQALRAQDLGPEEMGTIAYYDPDEDAIVINTSSNYWADAAAAGQLAEQMRSSGYWSSGNLDHPLWHEYGHLLWYRRSREAPRRGELTPAEQAIARQVSERAAESRAEFVSEFFAGQHAGQDYDEDAKQLFQKLGGVQR